MENDNHVFHAKITKSFKVPADGEERLFIEGYASTGAVDRDDEIVVPDKDAWEEAIRAYMKNPVMLDGHFYGAAVGRVTEMRIDPGIGFWIKGFISKTATQLIELIKEEIVRAFSIGFRLLESEVKDDIRYLTKFELYEVSIVSVPANREALFNISKAFKDGTDLYVPERKLTDEIDKLLTQKIAAMGIKPAAKSIISSQVKGQAAESQSYKNLVRVLSEIDKAEADRKIRHLQEMINNE